MFEIPMGQCPTPIVVCVGVVPAQKRSMETMSDDFGLSLVEEDDVILICETD